MCAPGLQVRLRKILPWLLAKLEKIGNFLLEDQKLQYLSSLYTRKDSKKFMPFSHILHAFSIKNLPEF